MHFGTLPKAVTSETLESALANLLVNNEESMFACKVRFFRSKIFVITSMRCILMDPSKLTLDKESNHTDVRTFKITSDGFEIKFSQSASWYLTCDEDDRG